MKKIAAAFAGLAILLTPVLTSCGNERPVYIEDDDDDRYEDWDD